MTRISRIARIACVALATSLAIAGAQAQDVKHYRFAYDQPRNTGYSIAGDIFAERLKELSKGTMIIDQYPGAQLGQEPQVLQLMKAGDIEFCISSSANAATLSPQAGVMSLHFLFRSEDHLKKALADPKVVQAVKDMIEDTVQGGHVLAVITLGLRNMYSKKEIHKLEDMKGLKVRVQATATEDTMFPAYGAQTVHMPFGNVYTSLQTGVVDVAENGVNVYRARGEQQSHLDQRQAVEEPERRAEALGPDRGRRSGPPAAPEVARPRASVRRQVEVDRRQGRDRCRQVRLHPRRCALPRQAREGAGPPCRQDQGPDRRGSIRRRPFAGSRAREGQTL